MVIYITIAALIGLAGLFNGAADKLRNHFKRSFARNWNEQFWDPKVSWRRKYKNRNPEEGPAFCGSTTFLVFLTDGWHLVKFLQMACFRLAVIVSLPFAWYYLIAAYIALWAIQAGGFHVVYTLLDKEVSSSSLEFPEFSTRWL